MLRFLKTEPAAVVAVVVAAFGVFTVSGGVLPDGAVEAAAKAVPAVMVGALALVTRPVKVPLVVAAVVELLLFATVWGVDLPGDDAAFVAAVSTLLTAGGALVVRMGVSPLWVLGPVDDFAVDDTPA